MSDEIPPRFTRPLLAWTKTRQAATERLMDRMKTLLLAWLLLLPGARPAWPLPTGPERRLLAGEAHQQTMSGGEGHYYEFHLRGSQYVHFAVEQHGIDVTLRLIAPDGSPTMEVDSPNGDQGPENLHALTRSPGLYRLQIESRRQDAPSGRYEIRLEALRPATARDRQRVAAVEAFGRGEERRRVGSQPALHEALLEYGEALGLWQELGEPRSEAETLYKIGLSRRLLGELPEALEIYREALRRFRTLGESRGQATLLSRIAWVEQELGDIDAAIESRQQALALFESLGDRRGAAFALNYLGDAHVSRRRHQVAFDFYERAREIFRDLGYKKGEAIVLNNVAFLLLALNELEEAGVYFERSLKINEALSLAANQAVDLRGLGEVARRQGETEKALDFFRRALDIRVHLHDPRGEGELLHAMGNAWLDAEDLEQSENCFLAALEIFRQNNYRAREAFTLTDLGRQRLLSGAPELSLRHYTKALETFREIQDLRGIAVSLAGEARALMGLGRPDEAYRRLASAIESIEKVRLEIGPRDLRTSYFASRQRYYELQIETLKRLHDLDPRGGFDRLAFQFDQRRRARSLLEAIDEARALRIGQGPQGELAQRRDELQTRLNEKTTQLGESDEAPAIPGEIRRLLRELEEIRTETRTRGSGSPKVKEAHSPSPLNLERIRQELGDTDTVALVYALGDTRSFLWQVTREAFSWHALPPREKIEDAVRSLKRLWRHPSPAWGARTAGAAADLSRVLLAPAAEQLRARRRVVVVPDGALHELPFAALPRPGSLDESLAPTGGEPLVRRHEIVHLPSISVLAALRTTLADRQPAPRTLAVVADPVFTHEDTRVPADGKSPPTPPRVSRHSDVQRAAREIGREDFERLLYSRFEAEYLLSLVPEGERLGAFDFAASKRTVTAGELRRFRIVHFATHALVNRQYPELSGIVLSLVDDRGRPQDGFLRQHEIFDLNWGADLVVLSACETGLGKAAAGEGPVGLSHAFMSAGVPRLIVSLWKVDDEGTAELMRRLYRGILRDGLSPPQALRAAQLSMLEDHDWSAPRFWAPFVYQGEWQPTAPFRSTDTGDQHGTDQEADPPR